ncbi:MAG: selenium metabolism-associated LysR family transcriptional regulator [Desulfobacterium sp.]|jgi:DNA-binding transcriptional LysR family regulator|nr:selenium metabolism-associated LysR family transcriptional regulator [Desulfobacterium sp.]
MDLWQLRIFVNVVEQQSFSKAGEVIHLSQPTVSSHIKELEDHFGCRLMDRMGRNTVPTKAGKILFSYAKRLLRLKDETESAMSDFLGKPKGHLIIGGSTIPSDYILPRIIAPLAHAFPEIALSFVAGDSTETINRITEGEIEVGVVGVEVKSSLLIQEMLVEDELKLVVPSTHRWADRREVTPAMLLAEPFLHREEGSGTRCAITQSMEQAGFTAKDLKIIATMGNTASMIQAILNGAGISILSPIAVADLLESGRLKALTVLGLDLKRSFYITTHGRRTLSPLSKTFIQFLKDHFQKN